MSDFVCDASVALAYLLPDETFPALHQWLIHDRLGQGKLWVPSHWWAELTNGLIVAVRRRRIEASVVPTMLATAASWFPEVTWPFDHEDAQKTAHLAQAHQLSLYDAMYLQLALNLSLPIAGFDKKMLHAARALNIPILLAPMKDTL
jgi:predicted nucleic acid-binding protein